MAPLSPRERKFVFGLNFAEILLIIVFVFFSVSVFVTQNAGNNLEKSVLWTACSMTYSHCDIPIIYNRQVNIISIANALSGGAILIMLVWTFAEHLLEMDLRAITVKRKALKLKNHFIVCGYGRVGEQVCAVLARAKKDFIVIEKRKEQVQNLRDMGYLAVEGDAMNPKTLESVGIQRAKGLVIALGTDADNIYLALTASELNPDLTIAARAHSEGVVSKLQKAGAEIIVLPEVTGGLELGREILKLGGTVTYKFIHDASVKKKEKK